MSQLLQDLANVTASHMDDNNLYSGEIESVTEVLESLANVSNNELNVTEDQSKVSNYFFIVEEIDQPIVSRHITRSSHWSYDLVNEQTSKQVFIIQNYLS